MNDRKRSDAISRELTESEFIALIKNSQEAPTMPHPALRLGYQAEPGDANLEQQIEEAMRIMAKIIVKHGDVYLPIFRRLEKELEIERQRKVTMESIKSLSESS